MTKVTKKKVTSPKESVTGRKWFDGKDEEAVLTKCKEVWALGGTDAEAAYYAEISTASISRYLSAHSDVLEFRNRLKEKPVLLARQTVIAKIPDSYANAMDYLSRKRKAEFSTRSELTGAEGKPLMPDRKKEINEALKGIL
jgi:hypothetical protein